MASDLILNVLQLKNEELTTRLRRVTLENLIHDDNDFPVSIPVLGEHLSFTFPSDYMLLAVLHRRPKPLLRLSAVRSEDGRPMIQYPREALAAVDDLLRTLLLPKTQFITFRADKDVGILLCPDITYISESGLKDGRYYQDLICLLEKLLLELDKWTDQQNLITLSTMRQGEVSIRQLYTETKTTFDYSWNTEEPVRTYPSLHITPLQPDVLRELNALEQEFIGDINHLMFLEASLVLDRIMQKQFFYREPLSEIIVAVVARLRNVVAALEFLVGISQEEMNEISDFVDKVALSGSVPELQDRIHDFFALISEISPRQPMKKSQQILEFIESNYTNPALSAQLICDRFRISRSYLSKILQTETGCGLVERIHDIRVQHAKRLLTETAMSIEQVAEQVGFSNRFGLLRAFKQIEGCSPTEYRNSHSQNPSANP